MKEKKGIFTFYILTVFFLVIVLFPFLWTFLTSLKEETEMFSQDFHFLPLVEQSCGIGSDGGHSGSCLIYGRVCAVQIPVPFKEYSAVFLPSALSGAEHTAVDSVIYGI